MQVRIPKVSRSEAELPCHLDHFGSEKRFSEPFYTTKSGEHFAHRLWFKSVLFRRLFLFGFLKYRNQLCPSFLLDYKPEECEASNSLVIRCGIQGSGYTATAARGNNILRFKKLHCDYGCFVFHLVHFYILLSYFKKYNPLRNFRISSLPLP